MDRFGTNRSITMNMKKHIFAEIIAGVMLALAVPAMAEETNLRAPATVTSSDGALSIQLPTEEWKAAEDENHLLSLTDGDDLITIDRLSRTDPLPEVTLTDDTYGAAYQTYVATRDVVYVIKGAAEKAEDLEAIMRSIGTIRILAPGSETIAAQPAKETEAPSQFGLRSIGAVYYVTGDDLNVRTGYSMDDEVIGSLYRGEEAYVDGAVTKDGQDYGWCQIRFKDRKAYVSADFLTPNKPVLAASSGSVPASSVSSGSGSTAAPNLVYCDFCGKWYEEGNVFRNHICPARDAAYAAQSDNDSSDDLAYCEYCGQWYESGNVFRNHICPGRDAANAASAEYDVPEEELVYCEYCGQWYPAGNVFRNHVCPERDAAYAND